MYRQNKPSRSSLKVNQSFEGERLELKVSRLMNNGDPIDARDLPKIYTDRKDGVRPELNIRTDKMEIALDGMTKAAKTRLAKRTERHAPKKDEKDGGAEPIQGTGDAAA